MARGGIAPTHSPVIRADDPWVAPSGKHHQLLTEDERSRLAAIGSVVRFNKGAQIYQQGTSTTAAFNIISGVVKAYRTGTDGTEHIVAFLFPGDLFGLAEGAKYTNSTRALTPVTAFQIAIPALRSKLTRDATLDFHVICKLCQELRQAQQHSLLLARRHAVPKLAAFLQLLEQHQDACGERGADIYLPMNRSEIGDYVGMSLEAVSRAFRTLTARGIVKSRDRRHLVIADRNALKAISA
jgi:CRP/FNR family transcriptional regulator, anaerobic regulatory protein